MIDKQILHYKILEKLGSGGMGVVYKANDTKLNRTVALKFLSTHLTYNEEAKERLIREARAAAALNHSNICTIHDIGEWEDQIFIVMEYIEGKDLVGAHCDVPIEQIIEHALQIAEGLQAAHEKGIIHRDIKSSNIMITADGKVKIMDFGLAQSVDQSKITQDGSIRGTTAYMSFEQANGKNVDHRTDIWSLGVVLYEMLTGQLPFKGENDQVILYSILNKEPEPIIDLQKDVPIKLEQIVNKALSKDINERYQTVQEILNDLKNIDKPGTIQSNNRKSLTLKKRWYIYAISLLILIVAVIGGGYINFKSAGNINSIAVLPLKNLSGDPDQKYFVEGMQEALITNLSQISALRVISKTSTMRYQTTEKSIPEIASELNVDALVEGSILRDSNEVRITTQLILGSEDDHLWAKSYDRNVDQVLPLISEIAQTIAEEINITVSQYEMERLAQKKSVDIKVHELTLQGRYYLDRFQFYKSLQYYQQAVELDDEFAPAHAGASMSYVIIGFFGWSPANEVIPKSREAALRAIAIDETVPEAYASLGFIQLYYDWDWELARKNLLKALQLKPNDALIRHAYADYLMVMGDLEESLNQVKIGRLYDPLSGLAGMVLDFHRILMRQYDEVIEDGRNAIANNPDMISHLPYYRDALWLNGNYKEAFKAFKKTWGKDKELLEVLEKGYTKSGYKGAIFNLAETLKKSNPPYEDYITLGQLYAQADQPDSALIWIEKAYQSQEPKILHVFAMPEFDSLHSDSKFLEIFRKIGFPNIPQ